MLFEYKPTRRVGFEDGDAFFVANAAPLFAGISEDVELEYLVLPRQSYSVSNPNGGNFPEENLDDVDSKLPVEPKGLKLTVRNVPLMQQKQLSKFIPPKTTQHEWFVFLMDQDYEVDKYGLGYRYNDKPFERAIKRPFEFELIDCLFMEDRFPKGDAHKPWPKPLRVNWNAEHANVRFSDVKLVFVLWYEGVYFYSKPEHDFYQMVNNELQKWSNAKKVDTQIFK